MRTDPSVLPLSAMTISAHKPWRSMARMALAMHCGSVCSSFRHGITNETSTRSLFIDGKCRMPVRVRNRGDACQTRRIERARVIRISDREEDAARGRRAKVEGAVEVPHSALPIGPPVLDRVGLPGMVHQ